MAVVKVKMRDSCMHISVHTHTHTHTHTHHTEQSRNAFSNVHTDCPNKKKCKGQDDDFIVHALATVEQNRE
jgi:hypothetical protein